MTESPILRESSTLTDRYQTTVPEAVRKALQLGKRDKIHYAIQPDGSVVMSRHEETPSDPALDQFLLFLAQDIHDNPERIQAIDNNLLKQIKTLIEDVDIDLDSPLADEDE